MPRDLGHRGRHCLRGEDIVTALKQIIAKRTVRKCLFIDNDSEFSGQALALWECFSVIFHEGPHFIAQVRAGQISKAAPEIFGCFHRI
jgi:hypothetical protein